MSALRPITIVGGGLAGLMLGNGLRQQGIPVTVWEAGHYPRHRVCGLFHRLPSRGHEAGTSAACKPAPPEQSHPAGSGRPGWFAFRNLSGPGTLLGQRLHAAVFDEGSFCAVAGIGLRPHRASARPECCIGDALTMTPPVTGNGMSMAFEAAEMAIGPLAAYCHRACSWEESRQSVAAACDGAFAPRLAWARWSQWMMLTPLLQGWPGLLALRSQLLWRVIFAHTR